MHRTFLSIAADVSREKVTEPVRTTLPFWVGMLDFPGSALAILPVIPEGENSPTNVAPAVGSFRKFSQDARQSSKARASSFLFAFRQCEHSFFP